MRLSKVYIGLALALLILCGTGCALADVPIDDAHFPDPVFQLYVSLIIDEDENGVLSDAEIEAVDQIYCPEVEIHDLTGIECFPHLQALACNGNKLVSLDVSQNPMLMYLSCGNNYLNGLDVKQNTWLMELYCGNNMLYDLDVSQNPLLVALSCEGAQLTRLDVSQNQFLGALNCSGNHMGQLDVSKNQELQILYCANCSLESLDVSRNLALTELRCGSNPLTWLDVSQNQALQYLDCNGTRLAALDLSKNENLTACDLTSVGPNIFAEGGVFDMSTLPGFDISKTSEWSVSGDEYLEGTILHKKISSTMFYTYDCGNGYSMRVNPFVYVVPRTTILLGDVTDDLTVDGRDVLRLMKYLAGQNVDIFGAAADVNDDMAVDGRDVLRLMKILAGQ